MKEKFNFYFIRLYFDGVLTALVFTKVLKFFAGEADWLEYVTWITSLILLIVLTTLDFKIANKLVDKVKSEYTSILGAQLYGKAKLEKKKQDADLDIKMNKSKSKNDDLDIKMGKYK